MNKSTKINISKKEFISVVIASYNDEKHIIESLNSLLFQSYAKFEVIVVDDGSRDGTTRAIKKFISSLKKIRTHHPEFLLFCRKHEGISSARNYGISRAKGTIISVLDSDDEYAPDAVARIMSAFSEGIDLVYWNTSIINDSGKEISKKRYVQKSWKKMYCSILLSPTVPFKHSAIAYRKDLVQSIGCYDVSLLRAVDIDLMLRFCRNETSIKIASSIGETSSTEKASYTGKATLLHLDDYLTLFRRHNDNVSNDRARQMQFWSKAIRKNVNSPMLSGLLIAYRFLIEYLKFIYINITRWRRG